MLTVVIFLFFPLLLIKHHSIHSIEEQNSVIAFPTWWPPHMTDFNCHQTQSNDQKSYANWEI